MTEYIGNELQEGQELRAGNGLKAESGVVAYVDGNGNFIIEDQSKTPPLCLWQTSTTAKDARLRVTKEGDIVLCDAGNSIVWNANTKGLTDGPFRLVLRDDGNLVLYGINDVPVWASHTSTVETVTDLAHMVGASE